MTDAAPAVPLSVIVPVYSRDAYLSEMFEKLFLGGLRACCPPGTELVIVDDHSPLEKETAALAAAAGSWAKVRLLRNPSNLGYLRSANRGLSAASGARLLLCNSDTRLAPGALERLQAALDGDPRAGAAGPVSNGAYNSKMQAAPELPAPLASFAAGELARFDAYGAALAQKRLPPAEAAWLTGFCLLLRRELVGGIGLFDEGFGFGYMEEVDYAIRARRAGWRLLVAPDAFVFHGGLRKPKKFLGPNASSQTSWSSSLRTLLRMSKGMLYLRKKYGGAVLGMPQDPEGAGRKGF